MILSKSKQTDKVLSIVIVFCFIFWVLVKIPLLWDFVLFGVFYEMGALLTIIITVLCTFYFLVRWIMEKLTLKRIYLYSFLLGVITLLIIYFVYSVDSKGITLF